MRLGKGEYLGVSPRRIERDGFSVALTDYAPSQDLPWHDHVQATFFLHLVGELIDGADDVEVFLPSLTVAYHPLSSPHFSRIGPKGARGLNVEFSAEWLDKQKVAPGWLGDHRTMATGGLGLHLLRPLIDKDSPDTLTDLGIELLALFDEPGWEAKLPSWFDRVDCRIAEEFRSPLSLASLAREAAIDPTHLARVHRRRYGISVTSRLQRLRIQAAVHLVLEGWSIGDAAAECGLADQFHLSRLLYREYGVRPSSLKPIAQCRNRS